MDENWSEFGWAVAAYVAFRRLLGRPIGTPRPRYTERPVMVTRYQCACPAAHPHPPGQERARRRKDLGRWVK